MMRWLTALAAMLCVQVACMGARILPDSLTVGFVTCEPGPEVFELYGHEGVRVSGRLDGRELDVVFNYGLFDFRSPGFVWRFVKGETDYMAGAQPTELFLAGYRERGSRVTERVLPLTQEEARRMLSLLAADTEPGRETYRYKYFTQNCATKPLAHLENVTGGRLAPRVAGERCLTRRQLLERYNEGYPWYQLGIDLVLGSSLDKPVDARGASFIPVELDRVYFGQMPQRVLYEGDGDRRSGPTPYLLSPMFVALLAVAAGLLMLLLGWRSRVVTALWTGIQGLAGTLVCGLAFFSDHEGVWPNLMTVWLNPLWLAVPALLWWPRARRVCRWLLAADAVVSGGLLLFWPFAGQSTSPAALVFMGATVLFSIAGLSDGRNPFLPVLCRRKRH